MVSREELFIEGVNCYWFFFVIFIGILGELNQFLFLPIFSPVLSVFVFELRREEVLLKECRGHLSKTEGEEERKEEKSFFSLLTARSAF